MANTLGADISHYQSVTNYGSARAALDFVAIKITEGPTPKYPSGIIDSAWKQHFNGFTKAASEAGQKVRIPYHFMRGTSAAEITLFETQRQQASWEGDPMLDAEYPGVTPAAIKAWIAEWRRQSGKYFLFVYVNYGFLKQYGVEGFIDAGVTIWGARYWTNAPDFANLGWDHPQLGVFQYWDGGSVPGFSGAVDLDVSRVDMHSRSSATAPVIPFADEDLAMHVIPDNPNDYYVSVPANGLGKLFIAAAFGRTVNVTEMWAVQDTQPGPNPGHGAASSLGAWTIDSDRPGPIALPANTRCVTLRVKADHPFTTWCAA